MKKLFASDFDGTFYKGKELSKNTLTTLKKFRQENTFAIVTGRPPVSIQDNMKRLGFDCDFIIGYNGGICVDSSGKVLYERDFEINISALIQEIKDEPVEKLTVVGKNKLFMHTFKASFKNFVKDRAFRRSYMKDGYKVVKKPIEEPIYMISIKCKDHESAKHVASLISQEANVLVNTSYIDIVCKDVSKAKGVAYLSEYIQASEVYVIGDSYNDVDMIEKYHGFSVHSAVPEIKQKASMCFEDVDEAITYVMEKEVKAC